MKRLALLSMISTPAFGHLVPYDSKAFLELAKGNPEKANYIAHFCSLAADSVDDCMSRLLVANGQIAAEKCGREINEIGEKLKEEMHLVGGFKGVPLSGYPHTKELCTKEEGCHRYGYTDGTREIAGRELGTTYVRQAREHAVKIQETDTNGKDVTGGVKGSLEGSAGMLGTEVKTALEGTAENTTSNEKATVKGGLTEFQIAKAYNAGFKKGWENPLKAGHYPDVFFIKGESEAVGADGKRYKNDPKFDLPPIPKDQLKDEGPASVSKPKENDKPTSGPLHPTSPTFSTPTPKQGASLDASDKLDGSWALIAPTQSGDLSPIQVCYEIEMTKIKKKEMIQTVDGDEQTYAQRKQRAEEMLNMGACDDSFFGHDFCREWKKKQNLNIDETLEKPSVVAEEQPFEEFATIEEWGKSLKDPFIPLEAPNPFSPVPAENCYPNCPIEGQPL